MELIDIHTHIIPGVDDGAANIDITRKMLQLEYNQGVRKIILTPHFNEQSGMTENGENYVEAIKNLAREISEDLHIYSGNEIYYSSYTCERLKNGSISTLANSRYVLVEFNYQAEIEKIFGAVNELIINGYQPIIAHIERYNCFYTNESYYEKVMDMGAYIQINAGSFLWGNFKTKRFCKKLLNNNAVNFIGSDCHNLTNRAPNIKECADKIVKHYGREFAEKIFVLNPEGIIQNKLL